MAGSSSDRTTTASNVFRKGPLDTDERQPTLVVVHHPRAEHVGLRRTLATGARLTLGREGGLLPGVFDESGVSRQHSELRRAGQRVELVDLGSRNGTFVNGQRVREHRLELGDVIGVGPIMLLFTEGPLAFKAPNHPKLIGVSAGLAEVVEQIRLVGPNPTTVLILGETGTGKELVAEALHASSGREGRFVAVNCGAVSDTLLHSELFGHVRGAFSGARDTRRGLIEAAADGTLFLDEIGDATSRFQQSLLRLLEKNEYRPVGADASRTARCRYVAATQPDVADSVGDTLRPDLWARLSRWVIRVPALRDRREDVAVLARRFARDRAGADVELTPRLVLALLRYDWPGNVRELQAVIERVVVGAKGSATLDLKRWIAAELTPSSAPERAEDAGARSDTRKRRPKKRRPPRKVLADLLDRVGGNVKAASEELDVDRRTLYRWMEAHDIDVDRFRED